MSKPPSTSARPAEAPASTSQAFLNTEDYLSTPWAPCGHSIAQASLHTLLSLLSMKHSQQNTAWSVMASEVFIFLLAATRCCLQCVETAAIFQVAPLSILSQSSGVPLQQLRDTGLVLSGIYGTYAAFFRKPRKMFKYFVTARRALEVLQEHGDTTPRTTFGPVPRLHGLEKHGLHDVAIF